MPSERVTGGQRTSGLQTEEEQTEEEQTEEEQTEEEPSHTGHPHHRLATEPLGTTTLPRALTLVHTRGHFPRQIPPLRGPSLAGTSEAPRSVPTRPAPQPPAEQWGQAGRTWAPGNSETILTAIKIFTHRARAFKIKPFRKVLDLQPEVHYVAPSDLGKAGWHSLGPTEAPTLLPREAQRPGYLREGFLDAAKRVLHVHRLDKQALPQALDPVNQLPLGTGGLME